MKWAIAAIALVVVANGFVLVTSGRERAAPANLATVNVCAGHLIGGRNSDVPPALRLAVVAESLSLPAGLDGPGLRALGFTEPAIAAVGRERDSTFRWPRSRPVWVRLRQRSDSLAQWAVVEVAPRRELLAPDTASIVVRGLVSFRVRWSGPPPEVTAGHQHGVAGRLRMSGEVYPAVTEVIPSQLHLDRSQIATLRGALGDSAGCVVKQQAVIANGAKGGIWVDAVH
jgi:hypothetical protein